MNLIRLHRGASVILAAVLLIVGLGMALVRRDEPSRNIVYNPATGGELSRDSTNALIDSQPHDPVFVVIGGLLALSGVVVGVIAMRSKNDPPSTPDLRS